MMNRLISLLSAIAFATTAASLNGLTQTKPKDQDETVRLRTELVQVQIVVTDKLGRVIEDLKKEDFELLEQGRAQEVSFFSLERTGVRPASSSAKTPDPSGSERPTTNSSTNSTSRSIVLFLDTLHLSGPSLIRSRFAAKEFVDEQVTDQDTVIIASSSGVFGIVQNALRNRLALHRLIERINDFDGSRQSNFTPYLAAMVKMGDKVAFQVGVQILVDELKMDAIFAAAMVRGKASEVLELASYKRRSTLSVLSAVAERLTGMSGQRLLILLSDGFSIRDFNGAPDTGDVRSSISKTSRAGCVIYSIDVKGLEVAPEFDASRRGVTGGSVIMGRFSSYMSASAKDSQDGINALAQDTGGKAFFNTNDTSGAVRKAVDLTRTYYALAYYPPADRGTREFRRISVRVKSHPEYSVRAQKGYFASDLKKPEEKEQEQSPQQRLMNAIAKPLPVGDLGLSASADYLEAGTDNNQVSLQASIDGTRLTYDENGPHSLELELAAVVYDRTGKPIHSLTETIRGSLSAEQVEAAKRTGFHYSKRIPLKPGLYNIRVGLREVATDRVGTAATWLEVPNLSAGKLTLSSILLTKETADTTTVAKPVDETPPVLGVASYRTGKPILYYLIIYNGREDSGLKMQWEIAGAGKVIHQTAWQLVTSRIIGRDKRGIEIGGQLGLPLPAGLYELRITITDSKTKQTAQRTVVFAIED